MRFVIFADKSYNYIKPISIGLHNTLTEMGHESEIWYDGLYWLQDLNLTKMFFADILRFFKNAKAKNAKLYIYRWWNLLNFYTKKRKKSLRECDCVIVVMNCPRAFDDNALKRVEYIRDAYHKPVVNYDFHYLPNQAWWGRIKQFEKYKGLEKYDWYLPVGLITEFAVPESIPQIYDCIGMDVTSPDLYPEQTEFRVLLDFPRPGHEEQRKQEKRLLDRLGILYYELNGRYTTNQIRAIYRRTSAYIVSSRESFGLPIVELQLCGAKILTPHKEWVPAHFLNKSPFENGYGDLGGNFIEYHDSEDLSAILIQLSQSFDPQGNLDLFKSDYPFYYKINKVALDAFINRLLNGEVNSNTHISHKPYNELISEDQDYESSDIQ